MTTTFLKLVYFRHHMIKITYALGSLGTVSFKINWDVKSKRITLIDKFCNLLETEVLRHVF
jgi:hypothetical protein